MAHNVNNANQKDTSAMRVNILGKRWKLVRNHTGPKNDGHCDSPNEPFKTIRVHSGLHGERELEIILHEIMHAADWTKDEEWIGEIAQDIAHILWRIGYRKTKM